MTATMEQKDVRAGESGCRKVGEGLAGFRMSVCRGHDKRYVLAQLSSQFMVVLRNLGMNLSTCLRVQRVW